MPKRPKPLPENLEQYNQIIGMSRAQTKRKITWANKIRKSNIALGKVTHSDDEHHQELNKVVAPYGFQTAQSIGTGKGGMQIWGARNFIVDAFHRNLSTAIELLDEYLPSNEKVDFLKSKFEAVILIECDDQFAESLKELEDRIKKIVEEKTENI